MQAHAAAYVDRHTYPQLLIHNLSNTRPVEKVEIHFLYCIQKEGHCEHADSKYSWLQMQEIHGNKWAMTAKLLTDQADAELQRKIQGGEIPEPPPGEIYPFRR